MQVQLIIFDRCVQLRIKDYRCWATDIVHSWIVEVKLDVRGPSLIQSYRGLPKQLRSTPYGSQ
jgi:hypothetical protein